MKEGTAMSVLPSTDDLYVVEITADGSPRAWCMARSAAIELLWQQLPRRYWSQEGLVVRDVWPDVCTLTRQRDGVMTQSRKGQDLALSGLVISICQARAR